MAETDQGDESSSPPVPASIRLMIKTAKDKETIDINPDASVEDVSYLIALSPKVFLIKHVLLHS